MKKLLIIALLFVGCEEVLEPQDCSGVAGGDAELDCFEVCGGLATMDACGICTGGTTNLTPNIAMDDCGVCFGSGHDENNFHCGDIKILKDIINNFSIYDSIQQAIWVNYLYNGSGWEKNDDGYYRLHSLSMQSGEPTNPYWNLPDPQFSGKINDLILPLKGLPYLSYFNLGGSIEDRTNIIGQMDDSICELDKLKFLYIERTGVTGEIPSCLGEMDLDGLYLRYNYFSGFYPPSLCILRSTDKPTWVNNNKLCPPYPECTEDYVGEQDTSECEYCIENPTDPLCN